LTDINPQKSKDSASVRGEGVHKFSPEDLRKKYGTVETDAVVSEVPEEPKADLDDDFDELLEDLFSTGDRPEQAPEVADTEDLSPDKFVEEFFASESRVGDPDFLNDFIASSFGEAEKLLEPSSQNEEKATFDADLFDPASGNSESLPLNPEKLSELFSDLRDGAAVEKESFKKKFVKNVFPAKGDGFFESLRKIVLLVSVITMFVCAFLLLNIYVIEPYKAKLEAKNLAEIVPPTDVSETFDMRQKYPNINFPSGMQNKHAGLYAVNPDFVAWLKIPGLDINMPVVRGRDNSEYLKKTFYGTKSKYGCAFLDFESDVENLERNSVIYGHNMDYDDLMFGPLLAYTKVDGFKNSPIIELSTLYKDTKWKVYAVFLTNGSSKGDNGYLFNYIFRNLSSDDAFMGYIKEVDQRKFYTTGVDVRPDDKILTLSTCLNDHFKNGRLVVVARLMREGESEDIDFSQTVLNPDPRYPQAWYNAKGKNNPYKDAERWYPN